MSLPTHISDSVRRLNPQLFGTTADVQQMSCDTVAHEAKKRLRQSTKPIMNALETRFHEKLLRDYPGQLILCQAVRLELARGIWYKPDFFLPNGSMGLAALVFEVKGPHSFRGGFENLKVAARVHKWISFVLVWEDEAGRWQRQAVIP